MIRVTNNNHIKRRKKVLQLTKGFRGRINNCYSLAKRAADKALSHSFKGRKLNLRIRHANHIQIINSWARIKGLNYSKFINLIKTYNEQNPVKLDRAVISQLLKSNNEAVVMKMLGAANFA